MPVHVNEVSTEIAPASDEPESGGRRPPDEPDRWTVVERVRRARARIEADEARTRAEGFHD